MNQGQLTSITKCLNCGYHIFITPFQEKIICEHCGTPINLNTISVLGEKLLNKGIEGEKEMIDNKQNNITKLDDMARELLNLYDHQIIKSLNGDHIEELKKRLLGFNTNTEESINISDVFNLDYRTYLEKHSESNKLKMRIKYFEGATKLKKISKGNWIDVYANKDVFVPVGERAMIPLGFALELPQGWEGHLAPRSSTFKTWGIIQTNHVGIVDDTYIGDNDQWHMPVYCLKGQGFNDDMIEGTWINKGDKIGQFRIMEVMPEIEFEEVESFGNIDRGGFGTSGTK
jgi:dUTP pyrophosphatase